MTYCLFITGIKFLKWIAKDKSPLTMTIDIKTANSSVSSITIPL